MNPTMSLHMEKHELKVRLRAVEPEDVDFMLECEKDRASARWTDCRAPYSRHQIETYALSYDADPFSAGQLRMIAQTCETPEEEKSIGIIDLYDISEKDSRAFVGISIHPDYRREGYGLAALKELEVFNREKTGLNQLLAKISAKNPAALRLFRKSGYCTVALLPQWHKIGAEYHDFHLLRLCSKG